MTPDGERPGGEPVRPVTVGKIGEDALVSGIIAQLRPLPDWVRVGPGDDAAVLSVGGDVVASTDTLVEGRDFLREWSSGHDVGVKLAAQNFADIAAMGAVPMALLVSLSAPESLAVEWTSGIVAGLDDETARAGAFVVGGDVSSAAEIVLTGTALGWMLDGVQPVLRSGARPGDLVALAGRTGASAAGWALLRAGISLTAERAHTGDAYVVDPYVGDTHEAVLTAHLAPRPPYRAGPVAARAGASSMIDTSDGLVRDAGRLASSSGVTIELWSAALAPTASLLMAASVISDEPEALARSWVMTGGEDHALLATFPGSGRLPEGWEQVGVVHEQVVPDGEAVLVTVDGEAWSGQAGWTHFTAG